MKTALLLVVGAMLVALLIVSFTATRNCHSGQCSITWGWK